MNERERSRPPPDRLAGGRCADPRARAVARSGPRPDRSHAPPCRLADARKVVPSVHDHHARRRRLAVPLADRRCHGASRPRPRRRCGARHRSPARNPCRLRSVRPKTAASRTRSTATSGRRIADEQPRTIIGGTPFDSGALFSPDGTRLVFIRGPMASAAAGDLDGGSGWFERAAAGQHAADRLGGMVAAVRRRRRVP